MSVDASPYNITGDKDYIPPSSPYENDIRYQDLIIATEKLMAELGIEYWPVGSQNERLEPIAESDPLKRHGFWFMSHFLTQLGLEKQDIFGLIHTFYRDGDVSRYFNIRSPKELSDPLLNRSDTDLAVAASIKDLEDSGFIPKLKLLWPEREFEVQSDFNEEKLFPKINIFLKIGPRHKILEIALVQSWIERFKERELLPEGYNAEDINPAQFYRDLTSEMDGPFYESLRLRTIVLDAISNNDIEDLKSYWPLITYYLLLMQREFKKGAEFALPMREKVFIELDKEIALAWQVARIYLGQSEVVVLDHDLRLKSFSYFLRILLADPSYIIPMVTIPESSFLLFSPNLYFNVVEILQSGMHDRYNETPNAALKFNFSLFCLYMLGWNKEFSSYLNDSEGYRRYSMMKHSPYFRPPQKEPKEPESTDYRKITDKICVFRRGIENTLCALFFFLGIKPTEVKTILKDLPIHIDGTPNSHLRIQGYNGGLHMMVDRTVRISRLEKKLRLAYKNFYNSYWVEEAADVDWKSSPPKRTDHRLPLKHHAFKLNKFMAETGAPILPQLDALFDSLDYGCRLEKYKVWRTLSHMGAHRMTG